MTLALTAPAFDTFVEQQANVDVLRILTCGSVDDGKSTLIGRLLYDSKVLLRDQVDTLIRESARTGRPDGELDFSLLLDGLKAEREQGITIDVAYRFFATERRRFIVADTPGHEQYTRNMATGASTSDVAILLVDARKGLTTQTRRHAAMVALMGIPRVVLAVNKMDLVGFDEGVFRAIEQEFRALLAHIPQTLAADTIPICALTGDNVVNASRAMPWCGASALLPLLERLPIPVTAAGAPLRLAVQSVNRPDQDFRGYSGQIVSGALRPGDEVVIQPSGQTTAIERIVALDGDLACAVAGQSVTVTLRDQVDVSRGDLIADRLRRAKQSDRFVCNLIWMDEAPMLPKRQYLLRLGPIAAVAQVTEIHHRVDVETMGKAPAKTLAMNEIAECVIALDRAVPFDGYAANRDTGGFILIDRTTNATSGCGMIADTLVADEVVPWQKLEIDRKAHSALKGHRPCVVWLTGLSGAGKSTIANLVEKRLHADGRHTTLLDGDNLRHGLNRDLGFTDEDRVENIRRTAEVARLLTDAGLVVLVSLISPFRRERQMARDLLPAGEFIEVFVSTPLEECERRDPKGLYAKARAGLITRFTGIDSPYEAPEDPDLVLASQDMRPEEAAERVVMLLRRRGVISDEF
jgi:bifunctional enzyme CysN/CysC